MIGIVGNGFVGNAVYQNLRDKVSCKVFDVDKNKSFNTLEEVLNQAFIFICLPTPMKSTGECDLSILDSFFKNLPKDLILENSNFLEESDSVIYTNNGKEDGFLFGSFKSFKVSSLPDNFKNYNRDFIETEMKVVKPTHLEALTKKLFMDSGKVLFGQEPSSDRFKKGSIELYDRNLHFTLYYNQEDGTLNIFYKSIKDSSEGIVVIVNGTNLINIRVEPHHWYTKPLGNFEDIHHVRVDNSEKVIYDKTFSSEFREIFKIKSYISNA